ncbi:hypothetical protein EV360DRAFT_86003 [Lentinula raphanica]|nr:hypothetical protein EV360DRAFT_86003 [Lentinula raphanica]
MDSAPRKPKSTKPSGQQQRRVLKPTSYRPPTTSLPTSFPASRESLLTPTSLRSLPISTDLSGFFSGFDAYTVETHANMHNDIEGESFELVERVQAEPGTGFAGTGTMTGTGTMPFYEDLYRTSSGSGSRDKGRENGMFNPSPSNKSRSKSSSDPQPQPRSNSQTRRNHKPSHGQDHNPNHCRQTISRNGRNASGHIGHQYKVVSSRLIESSPERTVTIVTWREVVVDDDDDNELAGYTQMGFRRPKSEVEMSVYWLTGDDYLGRGDYVESDILGSGPGFKEKFDVSSQNDERTFSSSSRSRNEKVKANGSRKGKENERRDESQNAEKNLRDTGWIREKVCDPSKLRTQLTRSYRPQPVYILLST